MKNIDKLQEDLEKIKNEFNQQISALETDQKDFHNSLIALSAKYPEHLEMLQFIVFINDKLETNQSLFIDIVGDTFNSTIENKQEFIEVFEEIYFGENSPRQEEGFLNKMKRYLTYIRDSKILITAIAIIAIIIGTIMAPDVMVNIVSLLIKLFS